MKKTWLVNKKRNKQQQEASSPTAPPFIEKGLEANKKTIEAVFSACQDVKHQPFVFPADSGSIRLLLLYCEGMTNKERINETILPKLQNWFSRKTIKEVQEASLPQAWAFSDVTEETNGPW